MKIITQNEGLLSNAEVAQVLQDRGAGREGLNSRAQPSERTVYASLAASGALHSRDTLAALMAELAEFELTRAELVQVMNLAPTAPVEVHLVLDECEERFSEEQVERLLAIVAKHLKPGASSAQQAAAAAAAAAGGAGPAPMQQG